MRRIGTVITAAATLGLAVSVYAQTTPAPGQPAVSGIAAVDAVQARVARTARARPGERIR